MKLEVIFLQVLGEGNGIFGLLFYAASTALVEGKLSKNLKKILKKIVAKDAHEQLAVADAKLGGVIKVITDFAVFPLSHAPEMLYQISEILQWIMLPVLCLQHRG